MSDFAPPASKLAESGIGVAAAPTGGMGLALDDKGFVPSQALVEAWREVGAPGQPAFENSYSANAGSVSPRFCKDALGFVHLAGLLSRGVVLAAIETIFTLPTGYWPNDDEHFICVSGDPAGAGFTDQAMSRVDVTPAGLVRHVRVSRTLATPYYLSLSSITFRAA